jgi:hypothetical protein
MSAHNLNLNQKKFHIKNLKSGKKLKLDEILEVVLSFTFFFDIAGNGEAMRSDLPIGGLAYSYVLPGGFIYSVQL